MSVYTWIWIGLMAAALGVELVAAVNRQRGDTFSEHMWRWLQYPGPWGRVRRWLVAAGLLWLAVHFLSYGQVM